MRRTAPALLCLLLFCTRLATAQQTINHNSTRSNKSNGIASTGNWSVGITPAAAFNLRSGERGLFRGNGWGADLQANWLPGTVGLGLTGGFLTGGFDQSDINTFITGRGFPAGSPITTSNPLQAYLLGGPVFQLGQQVRLVAGLQGGLFLNNAGSLVIQRQGALVPFYRFESDGPGLRPGWSGHLALAYPINDNTSVQLGVRLLQTATPIRLFDPAQGIDLPRSETRSTSVLTTGISLVKELGSRVAIKTKGTGADPLRTAAAGNNRGYVVGKGGVARRSNRAAAYDGGSGTVQPVTQKLLPPANAVAIKTKATGAEPVRTGCGPVTIKETLTDGRVQETTFSCPDDAAQYQRATVPKQTQGATFGERVNKGIQNAGNALAQGAGLLNSHMPPTDSSGSILIAGQVRIRSGGSGSTIVTNRVAGTTSGAASASYAATGLALPSGGPTLALFARDAATGRATGQRSFQPVYNEQTGTACTTCPAASVAGNPIGGLTIKAGRNVRGDSSTASREMPKKLGGDCPDGGVGGITVYLRDANTGALLASTETDACGNFWFAGVPGGNFKIEIDGVVQVTKRYDFTVNSPADVGGELVAGYEVIELAIEKIERGRGNNSSRSNRTNTVKGTDDTGTGDNQVKANINTSRSNVKGIIFTGTDTDGDGVADQFTATARMQDGRGSTLALTVTRGSGGRPEAQADLNPPATQRSGINTSRSNIKRATINGSGQVTAVFADGTSRDITPLAETASAPGVWQLEVMLGDSDGDGQADYVWNPRSNLAVTAANPAADRSGWGSPPAEPFVITLPLYFAEGGDAVLEAGNQGGNGPEARPGNPIKGIIVKGGRNPGGDIQTLNRSTNVHGEFLWNNLAPGSYRLETTYRILIQHSSNLDALNGLIR